MKIYLVDAAGDSRGQLTLLASEKYPNTLLSFAYKTLLPDFEILWDRLVANKVKPSIIFDSGAFTAFSSGKKVDIKEYFEWTQILTLRWGDTANIEFITLDEIGDPLVSAANFSKLEAWGLNAVPVFGYGEDLEDLRQLLERHDRIAFGGLVPYARNKKILQYWLDRCFQVVMARYKSTGKMPRIHLLGVSGSWIVIRYPIFSCDSSAWTSAFRFGDTGKSGLPAVPRVKNNNTNKADKAGLHNILRTKVREIDELQNYATKLWENRGIKW
jgi:hypothetical protein